MTQQLITFAAPEPATVKIPAQQELVQLFADGRISDSDNSNHFVQMENSERAQSESKFTPVRLAVSFDGEFADVFLCIRRSVKEKRSLSYFEANKTCVCDVVKARRNNEQVQYENRTV